VGCIKALVQAATNVGESMVQRMLGAQNMAGLTPLHSAAALGQTAAVRCLLEAGAPASFTDKDGDSPLHLATMKSHESVVQALVGEGSARASATNAKGATPLHYAAACGNVVIIRHLLESRHGRQALRAADMDGDTPLVGACLADATCGGVSTPGVPHGCR